MNTLKYKGYIGSVAYSEPDKVFFGKLEGIDDLVNYEGESVKEITDAFHEAVDDYLIFCEDHNVKPEKSYTGTFNVRISPDTHRDIAFIAMEEGISINAFVKKALSKAVQNHTPSLKPIVQPKKYPTPSERHLATLNEPEEQYGEKSFIEFEIPPKDLSFARELAKRFGWTIWEFNSDSKGLEKALEDISEGRVKEYDSVEQMMKEIEDDPEEDNQQ